VQLLLQKTLERKRVVTRKSAVEKLRLYSQLEPAM
jgi:hypothetical protein